MLCSDIKDSRQGGEMFDFLDMSREDLLRSTGMLDQVAGITRFIYNDGNAKGLPAARVRNGSGLDFTVLEGRSLEIYDLTYKGINIPFYYKNGLMAPERIPIASNEYKNYGSGGFMYTSGLMNSGPENICDGLFHPLHGRISLSSVKNVETFSGYNEEGEFELRMRGTSSESRLFEHNLQLQRTLSTKFNSNILKIQDKVINNTCRDEQFAIMYHMNLGFPFLSEHTKIQVPKETESKPIDAWSDKHFDSRFDMMSPTDNFTEVLYIHDIPADDNGNCVLSVINVQLKLKLIISFKKQAIPYLVEWKSMGSGDYSLGLMPSTSTMQGRSKELEKGGYKTVPAFGACSLGYQVEFVEL